MSKKSPCTPGNLYVFPILFLLTCATAASSYSGIRGLLLVLFPILGSTVLMAITRITPDAAHRDACYRITIGCVSVSLLLAASMMSDTLHGYDIHQEFSIFSQVLASGSWQAETNLTYNSALSISLLPSIISVVTSLDGLPIFQVILPLLFALTPIILYSIYRRFLVPEAAFLSVFLLMSYPGFYEELVQMGRQEIGELLLVILLWVLLCRVGAGPSRTIVLTVLIFGLVTAHYSLGYLYLVLIGLSVTASSVLRRVPQLCSYVVVALSAVVAFSWYVFVASTSAFISLSGFLFYVGTGIVRDFFSPSSRPLILIQALGLAPGVPGVLHDANRITQYLVQVFLLIGYAALILKRRKSLAERAFLPLMTLGFLLLGAAVVVPYFGEGLNLSRFYHLSLLLISPSFVYGAQALQSIVGRANRYLRHGPARMGLNLKWVIAASVLLLYFLFTSGWVWAVSMDRPTSLILDRERMLQYPGLSTKIAYYGEFSVSRDIAAARWLKFHNTYERPICADYVSRYHVLNSYGELPRQGPTLPSDCSFAYSLVFLSELNTVYQVGTIWTPSYAGRWPISDIAHVIDSKNRIYSNSAATIYL